MKALLVVEDDAIADIVRFYIQPLGLDVIRYRDPIKALDNLDEIAPDAVIMSARDFPRHWKTIVVDIRASRPKSACAIILLKGAWFPFEEAAKAAYLEVNGVIKEDLADKVELGRFQAILKRYIHIEDARASDRYVPCAWDRLGFIMSHPFTFMPIPGRIELLSTSGLSFVPDSPALVADLEPGTIVEDASLRIDDRILTLQCKLLRNSGALAFSLECGDDDRQVLAEYLASGAEREMQSRLKQNSFSDNITQ
jgi:hypothetical protein